MSYAQPTPMEQWFRNKLRKINSVAELNEYHDSLFRCAKQPSSAEVRMIADRRKELEGK